jgi:hypothetical protein
MLTKQSSQMNNGEVGIILNGLLTGKVLFKKDNKTFLCCIGENIKTSSDFLVRIIPELEISWHDQTAGLENDKTSLL